MSDPPPVVIVKGDYTQLHDSFAKIFDHIGAEPLKMAHHAVIKINLCDYKPPETGVTTHPAFLDSFLEWLSTHQGHLNVCVVESDASQARPDLIYRWLGIDKIIEQHGAKWVNLSKDRWSRKKISGMKFHSIKIPETIAQSDLLISMAKMKTHSLTTISCSLKNQFGCIMSPRKINFHDFLDEAIVDACMAMRPHVALVDGIIGLGGPKGPVDGVPVRAGLIVAGRDPVAVDSACARIMGLDPHRIGHLAKAAAAGLGSLDFDICGDGIPQILPNFETHEAYRRVLKIASTIKRRAISWG